MCHDIDDFFRTLEILLAVLNYHSTMTEEEYIYRVELYFRKICLTIWNINLIHLCWLDEQSLDIY